MLKFIKCINHLPKALPRTNTCRNFLYLSNLYPILSVKHFLEINSLLLFSPRKKRNKFLIDRKIFSSHYYFEPTLFISCHKKFIIIAFHALSYYAHCCNTNKKWKQYKTLLRVPKSDGEDLLSVFKRPLKKKKSPTFLEPHAYTTWYCNTEEWKPAHIFSPLHIRNSNPEPQVLSEQVYTKIKPAARSTVPGAQGKGWQSLHWGVLGIAHKEAAKVTKTVAKTTLEQNCIFCII